MSKTDSVNARIPVELKKKTQKQSIDLDIDYRDYVIFALDHYSEHVENEEIVFDSDLVDEVE